MKMSKASKICVGTAQFGMPYGIANKSGAIPGKEIQKICTAANSNGIYMWDTAHGYGNSERMLGKYLQRKSKVRVITKLPAVTGNSIDTDSIKLLRRSLMASLEKIAVPQLHGVLLHNFADLHKPGVERLLDFLLEIKDSGLTQKIGVSIYDDQELEFAADLFAFDLVQGPVNVFDQRLLNSSCLNGLKAQGVQFLARSVFLQGLLVMPTEKILRKFLPIEPKLRLVQNAANSLNCSKIELCLAFVTSQRIIDHVIVGVDGYQQFKELINTEVPKLSSIDTTRFSVSDVDMIDPTRW